MIYFLLVLTTLVSIEINGQGLNNSTDSLSLKLSNDLSDTDSLTEERQEVVISALPFFLYSEIFGWAVGGFVGIQGLSQRNMSLYTGGLISTNGTKYGRIQFREF